MNFADWLFGVRRRGLRPGIGLTAALSSGAQLTNAAPFLRMVLEGAHRQPPLEKV